MLALAFLVLVSDHPGDGLGFLRADLRLVCLGAEILDKREIRYVLASDAELQADLQMLRSRWRDLYSAPRLDDCYLFPERSIAVEWIAFNRQYRSHVLVLRDLYPGRESINRLLDDLDERYKVWDAISDCRCEYYYVHVRRQALKRLQSLLGSDYGEGKIPLSVPIGE
ncbi:MAG TPA: hypothetical protein PLN21_09350 [Gemmatales bacterium]|nr:hypothetical protein [Gemmatales bacterium]